MSITTTNLNNLKAVFNKLMVGYTNNLTGVIKHPCDGEMMGYCNTVQSQSFTKNNCAQGQGTAVTYTVPAGTYCMQPTLVEANNLALAAITANGQINANTNGTCICTPCLFKPQVYECGPVNPAVFVDLPATHLGLPAISITGNFPASCFGIATTFNFKIKGVFHEAFPNAVVTYSGPVEIPYNTQIAGGKTCSPGTGNLAFQIQTAAYAFTNITAPTLITASFTTASCGGLQTVQFYILP